MATTIELTQQELDELRSFTKQSDPASALRSVMLEYLRFARRMRLKELSGKLTMHENWPALEAAELKENHGR